MIAVVYLRQAQDEDSVPIYAILDLSMAFNIVIQGILLDCL